MTIHRVDQGMAVAAARILPETVDKELRTRYRQLPMMLHTAGLAATYAFIAARAKGLDGDPSPDRGDKLSRAYAAAAAGIREQLHGTGLFTSDVRRMGAREFLGALGGMDPVQYARASAEAAAFVGWLSRLADATWQDRDQSG